MSPALLSGSTRTPGHDAAVLAVCLSGWLAVRFAMNQAFLSGSTRTPVHDAAVFAVGQSVSLSVCLFVCLSVGPSRSEVRGSGPERGTCLWFGAVLKWYRCPVTLYFSMSSSDKGAVWGFLARATRTERTRCTTSLAVFRPSFIYFHEVLFIIFSSSSAEIAF